MERPVENYIIEARKNGLSDEHIKQYLIEAGWVPEQVDGLLWSITTDQEKLAKHKPGIGVRLRDLPDKIVDKIWNTFKSE